MDAFELDETSVDSQTQVGVPSLRTARGGASNTMSHTLTPSVLTWLRAFDTTVRHSSFTRAAEELHLTQGSISQQVKQLEMALGLALFHRDRGVLRLTAEGEALHAQIGDAFSTLRNVAEQFGSSTSARPVKLSCSPGFAVHWLTPRMKGFVKEQSRFDIRLHGEYHGVNTARMSADQVAVAIRYEPPQKDQTADWLPFLDELLIPVASPSFLKGRRIGNFDPSELLHDAEPWDGAPTNIEWIEWFAGSGIQRPDFTFGRRFNLTQLAVGAALDGAGIAIGRLAIVLDDLKAGRLIVAAPQAVRSSAEYNLLFAREYPGAASFKRWLLTESERFSAERDAWIRNQMIRVIG